MKTLKSTLVGTRTLDENNSQFQNQVREMLSQHREKLIMSILRDLPLYIDYRYKTKASALQIDEIKARLLDLKNTAIDPVRYELLYNRISDNGLTHISSESFQQEIDEVIALFLPHGHLTVAD